MKPFHNIKSMYYPTKKSGRFYCTRHQDLYTDLGYDYRGHIFEKTVSPVIFGNKVNKAILSHIEPLILYLIETVKQVKTQFMFSLDKNDTRLN